MQHELQENELRVNLMALFRIAKLFHTEAGGSATVSMFLVYLLVAVKGRQGVPRSEVLKMTGLNDSSLSRVVDRFSKWDRPARGGKPKHGLDWIYVSIEAADHRYKALTLTAKGLEVYQKTLAATHRK